jgi:predicted amidohydrolase
MILDPKGTILVEDESGGEAVLTADLESGILRRIREGDGYRTMRDVHYLSKRRPELYKM